MFDASGKEFVADHRERNISRKIKLVLVNIFVFIIMLNRLRLQQDEETNIENSDTDESDLDSFHSSEFEILSEEDINDN